MQQHGDRNFSLAAYFSLFEILVTERGCFKITALLQSLVLVCLDI
jgi:hypothetical protein